MLTKAELDISTHADVSGATTVVQLQSEGGGGARPQTELKLGAVKG